MIPCRVLSNLITYPMGLYPARLLVIATIVALVEIVLGTLAGAWAYKEKEAQPPVVQRAAA
jgi:hypothetical protein